MVFAKTTIRKEQPMCHYHHLTLVEREKNMFFHAQDNSERGSNENTNGLLREYFPKGQDITDIPDAYIQEMFDKLRKRPRKCLGYRTPYEVYYSKTLHLTLQFATLKIRVTADYSSAKFEIIIIGGDSYEEDALCRSSGYACGECGSRFCGFDVIGERYGRRAAL